MNVEQLKQPLAMSDGGILVPEHLMSGQVVAVGEYIHRHNRGGVKGPWVTDRNVVTNEWFNHVLEVAFRSGTQLASWYMTLYGAGFTPADSETAASFGASGAELTSETDGYTSVTRPAWSPDAASGGQLDNTGSVVTFTFASPDDVDVVGIAILSDNTKGGSSGVLASATNLASTRTFLDADTYDVVYRIRLFAA